MRPGIPLQFWIFTHLAPTITITGGAHVKCVLFVYVKHTVHSPLDKFPFPSILSVVLDCALKAGWWLWAHFHAGGKILSVWSRRQKNMGSTTESHLLCQLFFCTVIFPWERISAARITVRSVRAVSYLDMKEGKMEEEVYDSVLNIV